MSEEKKVNMNDSMDEVNGGIGGSGFHMTVGNCNGGYLALRPQPVWNQYQELAQLYPGYQVFSSFLTYKVTITLFVAIMLHLPLRLYSQ